MTILGDIIDEYDEQFQVKLTGGTNVKVGNNGTNIATLANGGIAVGTILDNDEAPDLIIEDIIVQESGGTAEFVATLSHPTEKRHGGLFETYDFTGYEWTALSHFDYEPTSVFFGPLTGVFPSGQTSRTISVPIIADTLDEGSEIFQLMFWQIGSHLNQVKSSAKATIVGLNLRTDANNDGTISTDSTDDTDETAAPGRFVAVGELAETKVILGDTTALDGFQVKFTVSDGIKVWTSPAKTQEIDGSTVYVLGSDALPGSVYVEGLTVGAATLEAMITDPDNVVYKTDSVRYTVFELNIRTDSNNDGDLTPADDDVKDEKAKRIFVNKDDDGKNGKPDYDPDEPFSAEEDDLAVTSLMLKFPADTDFTGIKARLTLDAGIKAWKALEGPGPKQFPVGATVNGNIYEWDLGVNPWPSSDVTVWIEGLEIGPSTAKFELIIGGVVRRTDTVKYSVEEIVWPSNETEPADINDPNNWASRGTEHWKGFVLGKAWWIEKSLTEIIDGDDSNIRTRYPEKQSSGAWQGTDDYKTTTMDLPSGDFTVTVEYAFQEAPDGRTINNFADTTHDFIKPGFHTNSGIFIGQTEIQIFNSTALASLLDAEDDGGTVVLDGDPSATIYAYKDDTTKKVWLTESVGGPPPSDPNLSESYSGLVNAILYNKHGSTNAEYRAYDSNDMEVPLNTLNAVKNARMGGQIDIAVRPNAPVYKLEVTCSGVTYRYKALPATSTSADANKITLQSHWGSGVVFTNVSITED